MNECCLFCVHYVNNKCALPALLCLNYDRFKAVPIVTIHKDDLETKYVSRQSFDEMKARAEVAESIIQGMFPMWIAAMSYCEHGRAASLDRMRNYYNGRDNPLTGDELHYLFSMKDKKNE